MGVVEFLLFAILMQITPESDRDDISDSFGLLLKGIVYLVVLIIGLILYNKYPFFEAAFWLVVVFGTPILLVRALLIERKKEKLNEQS